MNFIIVLLCLVLVGCNQDLCTKLDPSIQSHIIKGETTMSDIFDMLGQPQNKSEDQNAIVLTYRNVVGKTTYILAVFCDKGGVVRNYSFRQDN